jgi:hypothetical protein
MTGFMACERHQFESYDDYPQEASDGACRVLKWIDDYGRDEVSGMELTGLQRANSLCKREPISESTIARMAGFERHRKNSEIAPFFEYSTTVNITGVNTEQRLFIPIPTTAAAGSYHFIVSAVDKAGNEANFVEVDLTIINPSDTVAPLVTPVYPDFSATEILSVFPTAQDTVQLRIIGQLTDAGNGGSAGNLKGYLVEFHEEGSDKVIYQLSNSNLSGAIENMNLTLVLRRSDLVNERYYTLKVMALDHSNNSSYKEVRYKTVLN